MKKRDMKRRMKCWGCRKLTHDLDYWAGYGLCLECSAKMASYLRGLRDESDSK